MRITGRNPSDGQPIEIAIQNGVIAGIYPARHDDAAWLSAGLIDLQVNGYGGEDLNADGLDPETVVALTKKMLAAGATTYVPTLITASEKKITAALRAIAEAIRISELAAAAIPYVHLEGPNISDAEGFRGSHAKEHVRPPDLTEFERWQQASGGLIGMVTVSPHFLGVEDYIAALTRQGIVVSLGHTHAEPDQIRRAVDAGARLSTHLGNGIAASIDRHRNAIWTQLADDRLCVAMIADGHHVSVDMLKTFVRAKGIARSILVSDTVSLGGMPPGNYTTPIGGAVRLAEDGRLGLVGSEYLAGATIPLRDCVAYMYACTGFPLEDVLSMATINPGRFAGGRGIIQPGARADLIRFTLSPVTGMRIQTVIAAGNEFALQA